MRLRNWIDNLDDTDRKGMVGWGCIAGLAVMGALIPAIGWFFSILIALAWFLFIWALVAYAWLGWIIPERKLPAAKITEVSQAEWERALITRVRASFSEVREQEQARPVPVPDLDKVISPHRPETHR